MPTDGDKNANDKNANRFYQGFLKKMASNKGTLLHPGPVNSYLVSLFDENMKSVAPGDFERHWGIFRYDGKPKFPIDFSGKGEDKMPIGAKGVRYQEQKWCVLKSNANRSELGGYLSYACAGGDQVRNLKEGDVVIPTYIGECQECENCVSGKTNLCLTYPIRLTGLLPDNTSRMSIRGQRLHHVLSCATWSEYMVSDANYTLKVDPTIDPAHASFISCGFSTGYGAAWKEAKVESGSSVAVFGLGAVGLGVCIK